MSLIPPAKRVENQASPYLVSGNSAPVHSLWLLKCPCYVSLWQNQGPKCQLGDYGWAPGPDGNYVILTKRGKKRPDFTPFRQIYHFRVKYACYLHHLFHFDEICLQVIMLFTKFVTFVCPFLPHHWNIWILFSVHGMKFSVNFALRKTVETRSAERKTNSSSAHWQDL